ncbi:MAG: hypothetical protein M0T80_12580, partial [Actinomycetota bacterium]|nr:hypothetical protein [Actinomycetota bacterium]
LTEIAEHIDHARQGLDPDDEIGLLGVLDAVGDPETIAEEALGGWCLTRSVSWGLGAVDPRVSC